MWFGCAMPYLNTKMRVTLVAFSLVLLLFSSAEDSELKHTKKLANDEDAMAQFNEDGKRVDENLLLPGKKIHFKLRDDEGPTWTCSFFENGISIHSARPKGAYKIKGLTAFVFDVEPVKVVFSKPNIAVGDIFRTDSPSTRTYFFKILKVEALKRPSLPSRKINKSEFKFTKRMAEIGDKTAQYNLGIIYANGKGVPQDYKEAVKWYRMSAEQGHADAQKNLVMMYNFGEGVPQDFKEAVKWWRMSAKQGHAQTQCTLGVIYAKGEGVPQDFKEAMKWYRMSANQGYAVAQSHLGVIYYEGKGVPQDYKEAVEWWRMSAEQGYAPAQLGLSMMLAIGKGVPQDYEEAFAWLSVAKTNGLEVAERAERVMGNITKKMTKEQISDAMLLATEIQIRIEANKKD